MRQNLAPSALNLTSSVFYLRFHSDIQCAVMFLETPVSQIDKGNNTCPTCRGEFLKIDEFDEDRFWQENLAVWHHTTYDEAPTDFALRAEASFVNLCEAIVSWIEDQPVSDDADPSTEAEEWLCLRSPFVRIISLATFQNFAAIIRGPWNYRASLISGLQTDLPDPDILSVVIKYARQWDGNEGLLEPSAETYDRLAGWFRRIEQSRIRLYERLYGNNRRPSATRGTDRQ